MIYYFQAEILAHIEFPDEDFEFIWECCTHHYDLTVKAMVNIGGFLYGFRNRRSFSNNVDKAADLTLRQIDLVLKSLEMYYANKEQAYRLTTELQAISKELIEVHTETNNNLLPL
jgi:hypothetical protein